MSDKNVPTAAGSTGTAANAGRTLGFFGFFAITASMVMTVYAYPNFASSGMTLIFFLVAAGILWFLPISLIAAEMATVEGWQSGGIFTWVGKMLGQKWGFAALFYQWFQITVGFVTMCFFVLACLSYVVGWDALYDNPLVMFIGVAIIVWALTLTQLGGTKITAIIAKVGFYGGVCLPAIVLLIGLVAYVMSGGPINLDIHQSIIPDFTQVGTLVIFASFVLAFMGVEASASHIGSLKNPNRTYPMVMIVLCILAIVLDTLGGVAVATALPASVLDGNMSYGVISAFAAIFETQFHLGWLVYVMAILLAAGVLAEISSWIVGPSRALLDTAKIGIIPPAFAKENKHGVSTLTVIVQAVIVTFWDAVLCGALALSGGSSSSVAYLTAIGLTVVIYLVGYVLFLLAYFKLVAKHPELKRSFNVPGGKVGKFIFAGVAMFMTVATLIISFFPSSDLSGQAGTVYVFTLIVCFAVSVALPFVIYKLRGHWNKNVTPSSGEKAQLTATATSTAAGQSAAAATAAAATASPQPKAAVSHA